MRKNMNKKIVLSLVILGIFLAGTMLAGCYAPEPDPPPFPPAPETDSPPPPVEDEGGVAQEDQADHRDPQGRDMYVALREEDASDQL